MDFIIQQKSENFQKKNEDRNNQIFYDKKWEWGFLRRQCRNLELEPFYKTYIRRLQRSYLSIFIVIQGLVGGIHTIMLLSTVQNKTAIFPEIFSYLIAILLVWASLFITFREDIIKRRQCITYMASFITIFILVMSDIIIPLYHAQVNFPRPALRPAYSSYVLYAIYIFLPINDNWHAIILGTSVTICYLINFMMITYRLDDEWLIKTTSEGIFLLFINLFGIYFRLMTEIAVRITFLDRRECVEENLLLRYARDQEKSLLFSIIPPYTADKLEKEIREKIEKIKHNKSRANPISNNNTILSIEKNTLNCPSTSIRQWRRPETEKLFVEEHKDVSILYADVVNYTFMTTQLDVKPLVETLHELFVKFDQASEEYNVLRIKFLGDCYYCVSGVPDKNEHHAKNCVDLGLRMIRIIRDVRNRRNLNIDMRIGVHSGSIISGVIGACKWQYDIWSKDVDIANRLEATGKAGMIHVSDRTLSLLDDEYEFTEGTIGAKNDTVLIKSGITTFLIKPKRYYLSEQLNRSSIGIRKKIDNNHRNQRHTETAVHGNFMKNTIEQYNQIRIQAKLEMSRELDKMPIGKFHLSKYCPGTTKRLTQDEMEEQNFRNNVSTFFLFFKEMRWEYLFLTEPDVMLKYSTLLGLITLLGILAVQGINDPRGEFFWTVNGTSGLILFCFVPITWYKKLWIILSPSSLIGDDNHYDNDETENCDTPRNKFSKFLYDISHNIMKSITSRVLIYLAIVTILCASSMLHLLECSKYEESFTQNENSLTSSNNAEVIRQHRLCFNAWALTESLVLTLIMSFLFVRIPYLFKFIIGFIIVIFYITIVFGKYKFVYQRSSSTNFGLDPKFSHIFIIILTFIIFHLIDRQTEYIAKVDYNWKRQLQDKKEDAEFTNETIKILVHNILPAHVADIYMARKMRDELYSEKYENVAIMFASIKNYDTENIGLRVLNQIICDFDEILISHLGPLKIEKIKVAGWTYMAACGLEPGRGDSTTSLNGIRSSVLTGCRRSFHNNNVPSRSIRFSLDPSSSGNQQQHQQQQQLHQEKPRERKQSSRQSHNVVYVMTEFALELMKALERFNQENFQNSPHNGKLRIGISHGEIMAGVVGSSKPLYDVWGNAVNMASRMDSTGIPGKIQVTEETAKVLRSFGILCEYRGLTNVKGRGQIPTYFVGIDSNLNFIRLTQQKYTVIDTDKNGDASVLDSKL